MTVSRSPLIAVTATLFDLYLYLNQLYYDNFYFFMLHTDDSNPKENLMQSTDLLKKKTKKKN